MGLNELTVLMTHRRRKQVDDHHTSQNQGDADDREDIELLTVDKPRQGCDKHDACATPDCVCDTK
tara:strand:+ start:975 stop:1169 length:195 start_codon:yes stop_codon:yes gene_type:complete